MKSCTPQCLKNKSEIGEQLSSPAPKGHSEVKAIADGVILHCLGFNQESKWGTRSLKPSKRYRIIRQRRVEEFLEAIAVTIAKGMVRSDQQIAAQKQHFREAQVKRLQEFKVKMS